MEKWREDGRDQDTPASLHSSFHVCSQRNTSHPWNSWGHFHIKSTLFEYRNTSGTFEDGNFKCFTSPNSINNMWIGLLYRRWQFSPFLHQRQQDAESLLLLSVLLCTLKLIEINVGGSSRASVLHSFLLFKVAAFLFQGWLEKYLLTFRKKVWFFVLNNISLVFLFLLSLKVRKQKISRLKWDFFFYWLQ